MEENQLQEEEDPAGKVTLTYNPDASQDEHYSTAIDITDDSMEIQMAKPATEPFISHHIRIPTENVGCIFLTEQLQKYLEEYPPS